MSAIVCPRCQQPFEPPADAVTATCPRCGNVAALAAMSASPPPPPRRSERRPIRDDEPADLDPVSGQASSGMAIAAMVLGVVGILFLLIACLAPFAFFISLPCSLMAIVFGHLSVKGDGAGMATAGLVLGYVSTGLAALAIALIILGISACAFVGREAVKQIDDAAKKAVDQQKQIRRDFPKDKKNLFEQLGADKFLEELDKQAQP